MVELLGRDNNVGFTYYGERLKKLRGVLHKSLNPHALSEQWSHLLDEQSLELCNALLGSPLDPYNVVARKMQELVTLFAYGLRPSPSYLQLTKKVSEETGEAFQPGRWLVNFIPLLKYVPHWLPGAGFQRWAKQAKGLFLEMVREPFIEVRKNMVTGNLSQSFVLESLKDRTNEPEIVMYAAGSLFSAGTETLITVLMNLLAVLTRHQEVQQKAFSELNRLGHFPTYSDLPDLPYISCILQEIHRLYPPVALIPHSNIREEVYDDLEEIKAPLRIPKGSWVMANVWAVVHNEDEYPEPELFKPERFESPSALDPRLVTYGFGRRRCPGAHFADRYLSITIARLLTLFEIHPISEGEYPILEFTAGLVAVPKPFKCKLVPRPGAKEVLEWARSNVS
ncbi:hypothetical protein PM082_004894 [Marasmius tenuissimus]|nr:hypothetical protein PM082_004894 [Marasmius tenuissimus]